MRRSGEAPERGGHGRESLQNAALTLGSAGLCLLAAEVAVRLFVDLRDFSPVEVHDLEREGALR